MTGYRDARILVVAKTYPNPSQKYGETVCCAGVDLDSGGWVRMYPITFRRLAAKFHKYQVISCRATRPRNDVRPESWRVEQDTIELVGVPITTRDRWQRRLALLPPPSLSLEEIKAANEAEGVSIGMFCPKRIERLVIEKAKPWSEKQLAALRQGRLAFGEDDSAELRELEQIPWTFSYRFTCDDERCTGHTLQIIDWEIGEAYRRWSRAYPKDWEARMRAKFERELPAKDLHLVVGTMAAHPKSFIIIGLVYPPRPKMDGVHVQQTLDLVGQQRTVTGGRVGLEAEQAGSLGSDDRHDALELFPDEG